MYADDTATSAAGLQAHLGVLACYCERSAIVVSTAKVLLAGARTAAAVAKAQAAGLTFAGLELVVESSLRYLGITFAARQPLYLCNQRCAALGVAAGVRLRLISTMVDSVLSHGAEMWAVQLVAAAVAGSTRGCMCGSGSAAEALHMGCI